jgi:small subunit ribosomal protein S2
MDKLPNALIVVDPNKEINAIREARKLRIPVFGLVDTNCDPDLVDYVIPGNDDAVRSVKVILGVLTNAICEAKGLEMVDYSTEVEKPERQEKEVKVAKEVTKEEAPKKEAKKEEKVVEAKEDLSSKTVAELRTMAKEAGVKGFSTMKKDELLASLN